MDELDHQLKVRDEHIANLEEQRPAFALDQPANASEIIIAIRVRTLPPR